MTRPADEHSARRYASRADRHGMQGEHQFQRLRTLAMYLTDLSPAATGRPDAWLDSHVGVRLERKRADRHDQATVHYLVQVIARPGQPTMYFTACGQVIPVAEAIRTGRAITCTAHACAVAAYKHERPATVVTPSGPCHGGAAKTTSRRDATGNSVATRTGRDPLQLVKSTAVNRAMSGQPRSQVATAGAGSGFTAPATRPPARPTSSARAGRPSKGEPRVLESVAPVRLKAGPTSPVQSGMT